MINIPYLKLIFIGIISMSVLYGCGESNDDCLPYEGEIYDFGNPCSGIVIKVTNRDINSRWYIGHNENTEIIENVIGIRADPATISIDSSLIGEKFYFDFRELLPEEFHPCPAFYNAPSRLVFITDLSLNRCPLTED